jgi:pyruvate/2-oxoglutarate dehydrogenase complex dihydrolipoamide acyltransferase (E2) component
MRHELIIPSTSDGALAVTVTQWIKTLGDSVTKDEDLVEVKTEKINLYVTAPANGRIVEVLASPGDILSVGEVIGYVEED